MPDSDELGPWTGCGAGCHLLVSEAVRPTREAAVNWCESQRAAQGYVGCRVEQLPGDGLPECWRGQVLILDGRETRRERRWVAAESFAGWGLTWGGKSLYVEYQNGDASQVDAGAVEGAAKSLGGEH